MKILAFHDDCRDGCRRFAIDGCCSISCYPFIKAPLDRRELRRALNVDLISATHSSTLREAKDKIAGKYR